MSIWTTAVGAWGDSLCAYGNICKLLADLGEEKANVVYFGLDQQICEFFKAQPNIDKVSWLKIEPPAVIGKYIQMANTDIPQWMEVTGLKEQLPELFPTHITSKYHKELSTECNRDFSCALPPCMGDWNEFLNKTGPFILLQPFSVQSCTYGDHWPYWKGAIDFMLESCPLPIVLAGEIPPKGSDAPDWFPFVEHKKVLNLIGQTRAMTDLLHIANRAQGIVTTCNALAYWAIIAKKPAVVTCNRIIKVRTPYYYNWLNYWNVLLDHEATLDEFEQAFISSFC
jgi:hypothetical protein